MKSRGPRLEFGVGAFLILALASLLVLAFASTNGKWGLGGGTYPLSAKFNNIGSLRANAPVKIGGVSIGSVDRIELDPKTLDAVVTLAISKKYNDLSADTSASILTAGLLGESFVNLTPGGDPEALKPGGQIYMTQSSVDLMSLVGKFMFSGGSAEEKDNKGNDASAAPAADAPKASDDKKPADDELPAYLNELN